ncbi:uncharacterized protein [Temnothorax nylanderi]|uniref:uncharacterized protein n=1 Tax=Temnothorax nylanderi TaxID=102681 RepID=UPI003A8AC665
MDIFLNIIKNGFKPFKSEYKTLQYLQGRNCLFLPKLIPINSILSFSKVKKRSHQSHLQHQKLSIIPLKVILQKFLELPNVYQKIISYIEKSKKSESLNSIFQTDFWKSVEKNAGDKFILPLVLYFDDLEINNPLGSCKNKSKIGAVYCAIDSLPNKFSSLLENIFLVQLHNYMDHKALRNKKMFAHVINQINKLNTNGISINVEGKTKQVYFILSRILGDNLGLNTIMGFTKSFNSSHCCRICYISKDEMHNTTIENNNLLRNVENYKEHSIEKTHGIVENCIFNNVINFHVTKNISIDPMHDLLEGVCRYDIAKILYDLICKKKAFSVEILNERIKNFCHSFDKNIPIIKLESITNKMIILSASEMHYLVSNLGLFIGDLVPTNSSVWKLYVMLRKIVNISMLESVTNDIIDSFAILISQYLELYLKIFKCSFKVKHHYLTHYERIIHEFGPLKNFSTMRFEAKHKQIKEYSKVMTSRKCPAYSLSLKHQMQLCHRFICNEGFSKRVSYGSCISKLHFVSDYDNLKCLLPVDFDDCYCVSWVRLYGTRYEIDNFINIQTYNSPVFGKIKCRDHGWLRIRASAKVGLKMNLQKTRILSPDVVRFSVGDQTLEIVDRYVYLGHGIKLGKDNQTTEITRRMGLTWAAFGRLSFIIKDPTVPIDLKRKIYETCVATSGNLWPRNDDAHTE